VRRARRRRCTVVQVAADPADRGVAAGVADQRRGQLCGGRGSAAEPGPDRSGPAVGPGQRPADRAVGSAAAHARRAHPGGRGRGGPGHRRHQHASGGHCRRVGPARPGLAGHARHDRWRGGCHRARTRGRGQRHPERRSPGRRGPRRGPARLAARRRRFRPGPRAEPAPAAGRRDRRLPDRDAVAWIVIRREPTSRGLRG
jgi:hypothetical protein